VLNGRSRQTKEPEHLDSAQTDVRSFIVKVWLSHDGRTRWHGLVTHVPSGERRTVRNLSELCLSAMCYLEGLGVRFGPGQRAWRALYRRVHRRGGGQGSGDGKIEP
jgi:hypothetical protein